MIKRQLSLASIQDADEDLRKAMYAHKLKKLSLELRVYPTMIQFAEKKPKGEYRWLNKWMLMIV